MPFFIAPAAQAGRANSGAETNLVKAAGAAGILYVPSISSTQSIQTIGAAATFGQVMFHQEYAWSNQTRMQSELDQIKSAGFKAIFLTVDNTGINGIRDRQMRFSAGGGYWALGNIHHCLSPAVSEHDNPSHCAQGYQDST